MKILITGADGMIGRSCHSFLSLMMPDDDISAPSINELNLLDKRDIEYYLGGAAPDIILHLAAKVAGIEANQQSPATFYLENTLMNLNIIEAALNYGVPYFINISSACIYPEKDTPLSTDDLFTAPFEPIRESYALSKIAGLKLCDYITQQYPDKHYITVIPCNVYGPHDHFDSAHPHFIPAILKKIHDAKLTKAKNITMWGDGTARREVMYADDLADFLYFAIQNKEKMPTMINVGTGVDYTMKEYYQFAMKAVGYETELSYDLTKPNGQMKRLLDSAKARELGWEPAIDIKKGLAFVYQFHFGETHA